MDICTSNAAMCLIDREWRRMIIDRRPSALNVNGNVVLTRELFGLVRCALPGDTPTMISRTNLLRLPAVGF